MISARVWLACALLLFCSILSGESLTCNACNGAVACGNPRSVTCSAAEAQWTSTHLANYHTDVNTSISSKSFECFVERMNITIGRVDYMGCIFDNIDGCSKPVRLEYIIGSAYNRTCSQCSRDGCNPAGRATIGILTVCVAIAIGSFVQNVVAN